LLSQIESEVQFGFSRRYGFLTSNPKYVGTGLRIKLIIKIPEERAHLFRTNLSSMSFSYPYLKIEELDRKLGLWRIRNTKCMGFTELDLLKALSQTLDFLFTGLVDQSPILEERKMETRVPDDDADYEDISPGQEATISSPIIPEFSLAKIAKLGSQIPLVVRGDSGVVARSYIIVRRNVGGLPYKVAMTEDDNSTIVKILSEFSKSIPVNECDYYINVYC